VTISLTKTVGELALELPRATDVFEKLKIDYCCNGNKALADACASAGVKVDTAVQMLEQAAAASAPGNGSTDLQSATLSELIAHILDKHHVYTNEQMARLDALMGKVVGVHGQNHPELLTIGDIFQRLCADLKPHMFKEEQILFPYIIEMERAALQRRAAPLAPFGTVKNPVRMMMMEHDTVGEILRELRQTSGNYSVPADGCVSYHALYQGIEAFEKDLHQHMHLENNLLFPRAIAMEESA
jgi:regulator of cell morphogenesis and NO signaling